MTEHSAASNDRMLSWLLRIMSAVVIATGAMVFTNTLQLRTVSANQGFMREKVAVLVSQEMYNSGMDRVLRAIEAQGQRLDEIELRLRSLERDTDDND